MKKNTPDTNAISELLKKLHASYFGDKKSEDKPAKKAKEDQEDAALLGQLKATLDKASDTPDTDKPKKQAKKEKKQPKPALNIDSASEEHVSEAEMELLPTHPEEETAPAPVIEESKPSKKPKKEKKRSAKKQPKPVRAEEPTILAEEEPVETERADPVEAFEEAPIEINLSEEATVQEEELPVDEQTEEPVSEEPKGFLVEEITEEATVEEESAEEEENSDEAEPTVDTVIESKSKTAPVVKKKIVVKKIKKPSTSPAPKIDSTSKEVAETRKDSMIEKTVSEPPQEVVQEPANANGGEVSIPRISNAYDFTKERYPEEPESIVIAPQTAKKAPAAESIVIRPRVTEYTPPRPTASDTPTETTPTITINAMQDTKKENETKKEAVIEPAAKKVPKVKAEPDPEPVKTTKAPPQKATAKSSVKTPSGVSVPSASKATRKRPVKHRNAPIAPLPEDEQFNEALEDMTEEMIEEPILEEVPADEPEEASVLEDGKKMSIFRRRQLQKQQQEEKNLSVSEIIQKRSGLTDDDIAMMFELGYENELGRLVGYETMKKLRYEHLRRSSRSTHTHYRTAFGYRGDEYVGKKQNETVLAAYAHDKKALIRRVLLTALLTVVLFFADMPYLLGTNATTLLGDYPYIAPLAGMIGLLLTSLLSARQIYAGARSFMRFTATPYSIAAITVPLAIVYDLIALLSGKEIIPVNFAVGTILFLITVCDVFRICTELRSFRILSVNTEKTVLEIATPRKKKLRHGDRIVKVINDDIGEDLYRVRTADQTTGFFRRFNNMEGFARPINIFACTIAAAAFIIAFATAIQTHTFHLSLEAFITVWLVGTPVLVIFHAFYPLFRANKLLANRNCTLVGEEAVEEYADEQTVIFNDTDLYHAEKCTRLSVREGDDFRRDIRLTETIFAKIGGTLQNLAGPMAKGKENDTPVAFVRILANGLEAVVDNQYHVLLGDADFLRKSGIRVPKESTDQALRRPANVSLMYVAIDGTLKLSYEIEYGTDATFEDTILLLALDGTAVAIHSYDPNLTDTFLQSSRRGSEDPVSVIRPGRFEADKVQEVADTGAVALGTRSSIALPLHAAKCIKSVRRRGMWLQFAASAIGVAAAATLTFMGLTQYITPVSIALYQSAWLAISFIAARLQLSASQLYT